MSPATEAVLKREGGFTVLEFIVAISLLLIVLLPAGKLMSTTIAVSGNTRARIVGTYLASQTIEAVRGSADNSSVFWNPPPLGSTTTTSLVNNVTYTVTKNVEWVGQGQTGSNCSAGGSSPNILQVSASVTWPGMLQSQAVQSTTTLAPPVGAFSISTGAIASQVSDSAGNAVSNVTVSITGAMTGSIVTGADGCAFFAFVTPGTYTVSAVKPFFVSDQGQATPSYTNVVVTVSQTVNRSFVMGQSSTITASLTSSSTPAGGVRLSVANSKLTPYGFVSFPAGTTTLAPLFPYTNGYVPFAGSCTDSNPLGRDTTNKTAFYPTASGATVPPAALTPVDAAPGATTAASVQLYQMTLKVQLTILGIVSLPVGANLNAIPTVAANAPAAWSSGSTPLINWVCPTPLPTYSLVATLLGGLSTTSVPLGHYTIVQPSRPNLPVAYVWVEPDGTHLVNSSTGAVDPSPSTVTVSISLLP